MPEIGFNKEFIEHETARAVLFRAPKGSRWKRYKVWIPKVFIKDDDDEFDFVSNGFLTVWLPDDFQARLFTKTGKEVYMSPDELSNVFKQPFDRAQPSADEAYKIIEEPEPIVSKKIEVPDELRR